MDGRCGGWGASLDGVGRAAGVAPDPLEASRDRLLTVVEAARVLRLGRSTLYQLISRGDLETVHVGRSMRIPAVAIEDLIGRLRRDERLGSSAG